MSIDNRRPIKARNARIMQGIAGLLIRWHIQPNTISVFSVFFACLSGLFFWVAFYFNEPWLIKTSLVLAAVMVQMRLLCNLFDGMVAVEGGMKTSGGEVYNELPDRIADSVIFIGLAYGLSHWSWSAPLGFLAAILAMMTAYVRVLGGSCGLPQKFLGPFAKQQRMALVSVGAVVSAFLPVIWAQGVLFAVLWVLVLGSLWTVIVRTKTILIDLQQRDNTL